MFSLAEIVFVVWNNIVPGVGASDGQLIEVSALNLAFFGLEMGEYCGGFAERHIASPAAYVFRQVTEGMLYPGQFSLTTIS